MALYPGRSPSALPVWRLNAWLCGVEWLNRGGKTARRDHIRAASFPIEWLRILERDVPVFGNLPTRDQEELKKQILVFLAEKRIEGCDLELTDRMRVIIAAQACLLTLRMDVDYYAGLRTILVYPRTYVPKRSQLLHPHGQIAERLGPRLGESWKNGVVVLSWRAVKAGAADPSDGQNTVIHEFAHQLDQESGGADGTPLYIPSSYDVWSRILHDGFKRLRQAEADGGASALDYYGTTNPAEFFAVAVESFFERPRLMRVEYPELYDQMKRYFKQDPAEEFSEI